MHHAGNGHQHGNRDHSSRDQSRAYVAEQQEQDNDDQQRTFQQVFLYCLQGLVDQPGAVIGGCDSNALGQAGLDLLQFLSDCTGNGATVFTNQHENRTHHHFASVLGGRTAAQFQPFLDAGHIPNAQTCTVGGQQRYLTQCLQ